HPHLCLVVALILIAGGLIRHYFNRADAGDEWSSYGWTAAVATLVLAIAIYVTAPRQTASGAAAAVSDAEVMQIASKHCGQCHARRPTHESFTEPPKGLVLESVDDMRRHGDIVYAQAVQTRAMPLGNQTVMTEAARA